jgi:hypothetical protein
MQWPIQLNIDEVEEGKEEFTRFYRKQIFPVSHHRFDFAAEASPIMLLRNLRPPEGLPLQWLLGWLSKQ